MVEESMPLLGIDYTTQGMIGMIGMIGDSQEFEHFKKWVVPTSSSQAWNSAPLVSDSPGFRSQRGHGALG